MISNSDMKNVLEKIKCKLIVLAGDTHQIEAIDFGNWFEMTRHFIKELHGVNWKHHIGRRRVNCYPFGKKYEILNRI